MGRSVARALWGFIITAPAGEGMFATASTLTYQVFNGLPHINRASFRVHQRDQKMMGAQSTWYADPGAADCRLYRFGI
jgi:hypothetical protein